MIRRDKGTRVGWKGGKKEIFQGRRSGNLQDLKIGARVT